MKDHSVHSWRCWALAIVAALLCIGVAHAEPLDEDEARDAAIAFFSPSAPGRHLRAKARQLVLRSKGHDAGYYIFERPEGGVVFVADDDAIGRTVLGYTEQGGFDPDSLPVGLQDWLRQITVLMDAVHRGEIHHTEVIRRASPERVQLHLPLWNQRAPYNNLCPMSGNQRCITGCVATAMAEVMRYWAWPKHGYGYVSYYDEGCGQNLSQDLSRNTYDWGNMLETYNSGSYTAAQATAVATLMRDCGYAANMNYGPNESSASVNAGIMQRHFNYSPLARDRYSGDYSTDDWHAFLREDLAARRPVLYNGQSIKGGGGGHEFVITGYDDSGFYYVNWGWGGYQNGWFTLTNLLTYNHDQWMINHLEPDYTEPEPFSYSVNEEGVLTIRGKGMMPENYTMETAPWRELCDDITKIVIGEGITTIVDNFGYAYVEGHWYGFPNLKEVVLPEGLLYIGHDAFYNAPLTTVQLPSTVALMNYAFYWCYCITSMHLPKSLTEYRDRLPSLQEITVDKDNPKLTVQDNILYDKDCRLIYMIPRSIDRITLAETTEGVLDDAIFDIGAPVISQAPKAPALSQYVIETPNYYVRDRGVLYIPYESTGYDSWRKLLPKEWTVLTYTDLERIPDDPSVLNENASEPLATCYLYTGEEKTVNSVDEWETLLKQYPNAVAVVNPLREPWAYFTRNMLIADSEAESGYRCPYFRLTDFASSYSNTAKAATTGFAPPMAFTITRGFYTRNFREGYNTVCMPFAVSEEGLPEGCRMYAYSTFDRDKHDVLFVRQAATEAGHVCFVTSETNVAWRTDLSGTTITTLSPSMQDSHVRGTFVTTDAHQGVGYNPRTNDNIFAPLDCYLHPFRACFLIDEPAAAQQLRVRLVEDADGIRSMSDVQCTMDNEGLYTLDGKRLAAPLKGQPFIKNGKIVIQ